MVISGECVDSRRVCVDSRRVCVDIMNVCIDIVLILAGCVDFRTVYISGSWSISGEYG